MVLFCTGIFWLVLWWISFLRSMLLFFVGSNSIFLSPFTALLLDYFNNTTLLHCWDWRCKQSAIKCVRSGGDVYCNIRVINGRYLVWFTVQGWTCDWRWCARSWIPFEQRRCSNLRSCFLDLLNFALENPVATWAMSRQMLKCKLHIEMVLIRFLCLQCSPVICLPRRLFHLVFLRVVRRHE